jgi:hypothetical protein
MPLPVIDDVFRCAVSYHIGTAPLANVFHVHGTGVFANDVAAAVHTAYGETDSLPTLQIDSAEYEEVIVTPLDGVGASAAADMTDILGTQTGQGATVQAALLTSFYTDSRGRSFRGRFYLGGIDAASASADGTQWDQTLVDQAVDRWGTFSNSLNTSGLTLVVASYTLELATLVTQITPRKYIGTIRRRAESQE